MTWEENAPEEQSEHMTTPPSQAENDTQKDGAVSDWQKRHDEIEAAREEVRLRVRSARRGNGVVRPAKPKPTINDTGEKNVGIYTRVSTKSTEQVSSIENQTMYYEKRVADEPQWTLHEIYSDEGKSGTSTKHRDAFNRMLMDAKQKKIDLILCASVSRFARNVADCMSLARQLKSMNPSHPVGVYFETENIYTLDPDSMHRLSIHAVLADWESANKSARMILSYDQRIRTGQYPVVDLLGYRHTKDGQLIIEPEEAKTVRFIFLAYACGYTSPAIANILTLKERPTLKGRTNWNASMVRAIIENERRWGDLEARKTIVIDYVEHKSKRNEDDRVSAYEEGHHEGIVTPEIARAVKLCGASGKTFSNGVSDLQVITEGALKGFVSINPAWGGMNHETFVQLCQGVYDVEELDDLKERIAIWSGEEQSRIVSMQLDGYEVPPGVFFMNRSTPAMTISKRRIKFNKACHDKMGNCAFVEVLYHPLLQTLIVRESFEEVPNSIRWLSEDGVPVEKIGTPAFSAAIFENMGWKQEYQFRFRGVIKVRGNQRFMFFAMNEPQIILSKKDRNALPEGETSAKYIPYKQDDGGDAELAERNYPAEWQESIGMRYAVSKYRDSVINSITEADVARQGVVQINPLIGYIPSRAEIVSELEELLMSM